MFRCRLLCTILLLLAFGRGVPAWGQTATQKIPAVAGPPGPGAETGLPLVRNYHPREYAGATAFVDNWCVLQDPAGRMFTGNSGGILVYNGVNWQYIETPAKSLIRSLAAGADGRVYVGAADDLGYLSPDASGKLRFVSLLPHLPPAYRKFADIRYTAATPDGICFLSPTHLFRWDGRRMHYWNTATRFSFMAWTAGKLYVQQVGQGLYELGKDGLRAVSEAAPFAGTAVSALLPAAGGQLLVATRDAGLFRLGAGRCAPLPGPAGDFLVEHECLSGARLPGGGYAFGTRRGGVLLADAAGKVVRLVNKESGLLSNSVHHLSTDRQGGLWMATSNGISRMETFSPFSQFGESNGLVGNIQELRRYRGNLYACTSAGLFVLAGGGDTGQAARFRPVPGFADGVLRLFLFNDRMLIAGNKHLYELDGERLRIVKRDFHATGLHRSRRDPSRLFAASGGLYALRWTGHGWQDEGRIPGISEDIHTITETAAGDLFLATRWQGTLRVRFPEAGSGPAPNAPLPRPVISRYGMAQGLPSGVNRFYWTDNRLLLRIGEEPFALYAWDQATGRFRPLPEADRRIGGEGVRLYPAQDSGATQWWWTQFPADKKWSLSRGVARPGGASRTYNLNRISEYTGKSFYAEGDTVIWFRGIEGVVRYQVNQAAEGTQAFGVLLDRIVVNQDSSFYPHPGLAASTLPYAHNTLRFEFAAPAYDQSAENQFRYRLEGYDRGWSAWTKDFYKEYTRIPEGRYRFRVGARNLYGALGREATYTITIAPPWYRTWPAYGAYALLAGGLLYGLVRWRSASLRARNAELEKIVRERTWEIATQNGQLDAQNGQLQQQAGQLARQTAQLIELDQMKSNFFANLSHEFRTPLTLVLGILNDKTARLPETPKEARQVPPAAGITVSPQEISVLQRNARRLLQLINQLLDLSKLDSGRMQLQLRDGDLGELLASVAASFASVAGYRKVGFEVRLPEGPLPCRFDADKLEKIFYNLLSNAFKFTPDGGTVGFVVTCEPGAPGEPFPGKLRGWVQDSGPGIPAGQLEAVFDRFFQGPQGYAGDGQGTGIGLALTRELVQLHGGLVRAESPPGGGATFVVEIPLAAPLRTETPAPGAAPRSLPSRGMAMEMVPPAENAPAGRPPGDPALPLLLIVEDNADLRQYIRGHLEAQYRVLESDNGLTGWEMTLAHLPDLLISDWMMPGLSGVELLERVKTDERTSHIPFILLTALATREGKLTGLATGADEYLTKPFDARELGLRVRNLIETRRKLRERFGRELRIQPQDITVTSADEQFMAKVMSIVEAHMGDPEFGAEEFGREAGLSRMQLHRKLTALTGHTTGDFIRTMRLKRAAQLLEARTATVSEIAFGVGFGSLSYFTRSFREQFGVTPTAYAARNPTNSG